MTVGFQTLIALILISIGVYNNLNTSNGTIRSKKIHRNSILFVFVGAGVLMPASWLAKVGLPWWSMIVFMFVVALVVLLIIGTMNSMRQSVQKKRRH